MFCLSEQTTAFQNIQIFPAPVQEVVFFIRVLRKYKAKVAMGVMEGTVHKGNIPTWMESVFVTTFFSQQFPKKYLERFI